MKKKILLMIVTICIGLVMGCQVVSYPKDMKIEVKKNHARMQAYVKLMRAKKTTRKQDKMMIEANMTAWKALLEVMKDE